jgi:hypothetical protein
MTNTVKFDMNKARKEFTSVEHNDWEEVQQAQNYYTPIYTQAELDKQITLAERRGAEKVINKAVNSVPQFLKVEQDGKGNALFNFKQSDFHQSLRERFLK